MTRVRYDAVVLGGGPAGTATALSLLARGYSAAIVEASCYESERIGETLAPHARDALEHLAVWQTLLGDSHHVASYATRAAWGAASLGANPFVLSAHGIGWQLERRRFDALLANCAEAAGATVLRHARVTSARRIAAGWEIDVCRRAHSGGSPRSAAGAADGPARRGTARRMSTASPGAAAGEPVPRTTARSLSAATVVDATGRGARFATARGAQKIVADRLVAVHGIFNGVHGDGEAGVLVEACRDGWWYSARLPRERAVVVFLSDADIVADAGVRAPGAWAAALGRQAHTLERIAGATWPTRLHVDSARTQRLDRAAGDGWIAVGDAAATVDPLSSQGILKALRSGIFASYAIGDRLGGDATAFDRYAGFVVSEHDDNLAARATHYGREQRWPGAPFWERRHDALASVI